MGVVKTMDITENVNLCKTWQKFWFGYNKRYYDYLGVDINISIEKKVKVNTTLQDRYSGYVRSFWGHFCIGEDMDIGEQVKVCKIYKNGFLDTT